MRVPGVCACSRRAASAVMRVPSGVP